MSSLEGQEQVPGFPTPGHSGELHEWAKQQDAKAEQYYATRPNEIRTEIHSLVLGDNTELTQEQKSARLDELLAEFETLFSARSGFRMTDVFTGEAFNG